MSKEFQQVLIVDDCNLTLRRLAKELRDVGYLVTIARSGVEAIEILKSTKLDYVITDWQMPRMNGELLCQCIRSLGLEHYIYTILMTAHSELMDLVDGLSAGADDYITKPVNVRELLARMTSGERILRLDRKLHHAADHDPLTGVLNRRSLVPMISKLIDVCARKKQSVSTIMLDLDHLKKVNDQHGHFVGDHLLVEVAQILANRFRNDDYVCRYSGEKFVVILPDCDEQAAVNCAERFRTEIANIDCGECPNEIRITASFGVAVLGEDESATRMVDNADFALRMAKKSGRNRVVKFSDCHAKGVSPPAATVPDLTANNPSAPTS